jgi:hypothetical protein
MRKGELTPASFVLSPLPAGARIRLIKGGSLAGVGIATIVVERAHPDYLPLSILVRVLDARLRNGLASVSRAGAPPPTVQTLVSGSVMAGYLETSALAPSSDAAKALATLLDI